MIEYNVGSNVDGVGTHIAFQRHFWATAGQPARYVVIGGDTTLAHYTVLSGLTQVGISPWRVSMVGNVVGAALNYFISR